MLGWNILFMKPMLGDLNGYWSGSSTWIFQTPPANGATSAVNAEVIIRPDGNAVAEAGVGRSYTHSVRTQTYEMARDHSLSVGP